MSQIIRSEINNITPEDNFADSFTFTGTITAGAEEAIANPLSVIPDRFLVTSAAGTNLLIKGPTAWDVSFVYIRNMASTSTATVTIVFYKV